jgi:hypothetical protein
VTIGLLRIISGTVISPNTSAPFVVVLGVLCRGEGG